MFGIFFQVLNAVQPVPRYVVSATIVAVLYLRNRVACTYIVVFGGFV